MTKGNHTYSHEPARSVGVPRLRLWETRLRAVVKGRRLLGIYILFWCSVLLDAGSTLLTMRLVPQYQWVEANSLFYTLGSNQFFITSLMVNVALFAFSAYHQSQWGRGASLLYLSIVVHGALGVKNLVQLLRL